MTTAEKSRPQRLLLREFWKTVHRFLVLGFSELISLLGMVGNRGSGGSVWEWFDRSRLFHCVRWSAVAFVWNRLIQEVVDEPLTWRSESCASVKHFVTLTKVLRRSDEVRNEPELLEKKQKSHKTGGEQSIKQHSCRKWSEGRGCGQRVSLCGSSFVWV